jgi:hypothetical protein
MKQSRMTLPSRFNGLSIFASEDLETYDSLAQRAQDQIAEIKHAYHNKHLSFDYRDEVVRGKFVTALEGDFPGTYMVVLKIASSRICSGPCFLHLQGRRIGAIVVTGEHGLVGITAKAMPETKTVSLDAFHSGLAHCG